MHKAARDCVVLAVCGSWLAACGDSGPARESVLAEIAAGSAVEIFVLGTSDPATVRRAQVALTPAMRDPSGELVCPVLDATATINGLPLEQTERGGSIQGSSGIIGSQAGCKVIAFDRSLDREAELDEELSVLIVEDESARVRIEARNIFAAPQAELIEPSGGALEPERTAELAITPGPGALPVQLRLRFIGESSEQSFAYELAGQSDVEIELTERGLRFTVPDIAPGSGRLEIEGIGHIDAFRGQIERCDRVASCAVWRAACASSRCTAATSVPTAFDTIVLDTEVVAP